MTNWQELDNKYVISTYNRLPLVIEKGEGNYLYDENGKSFLDLFTGLAVNILGHSHPEIVKTIQEQGSKFLHISNLFLNTPAIQLAQRLIELSIPGKVFFTNSGAESTEAAVKLIHKWSTIGNGQGRQGIVVLKNSFHGRTLGAIALTRQPGVYQDFPTPAFPVYEIEAEQAEQADQLEKILQQHNPAAVLMEPVLGSGGVIPLSEEYLQEVARLCSQYGALCCMDEIQTGVGRTGKFFAYQHAGIQPDLILFAKGIGGGLPLGGIIAGEELSALFKPGDHGTTFAPAPLSAALGNTVLKVLYEQNQLEASQESSRYLWERLVEMKNKHLLIKGVRGKGMMLGVQTNATAEMISKLQKDMLADGILLDITQKTIIRLLPPLTLTKEDIDLFISKLDKHLEAIA